MTGGKGMFYLQYDLPQLVRFAEDKLRDFDAERLTVPKPLDAFDFIEFDNGLNLQTDPQRLTPNLSIWGLTAFNDGYWWVWPEDEEFPRQHPVNRGTILIDERLLLPDASLGWRNFTLLHEGFHWVVFGKMEIQQKVTKNTAFVNLKYRVSSVVKGREAGVEIFSRERGSPLKKYYPLTP